MNMKEVELLNISEKIGDDFVSSSKIILGYSETQLRSMEFINLIRSDTYKKAEYVSYKITKENGSIIDDYYEPQRNTVIHANEPGDLSMTYPLVELDIGEKEYTISISSSLCSTNTFKTKSGKLRIISGYINGEKLCFSLDGAGDAYVRFDKPDIITTFLNRSFRERFEMTGFSNINDVIEFNKKLKSIKIDVCYKPYMMEE